MTETLLLLGVLAMVGFGTVVTVEGSRRPGYDPRYHTGSELELGRRGWVQRANFAVVGSGMILFAIGVLRALDAVLATVLLVVAGVALLGAGAFPPDPVRGYPPGASTTGGRPLTVRAKIHDVTGPLAFVALITACLDVATHLEGAWRVYTLTTVVVGVGFLVGTLAAYRRDARNTGLVQRVLILSAFLWVAVIGISLALGMT